MAACRIHSVPSSVSCSGASDVEGDRVDQVGAGALAAQLDQVGAGGVAVAGRALGVDGDRTGAPGDRAHRPCGSASSDSTTAGRPSRSVEQRALGAPPRLRERRGVASGVVRVVASIAGLSRFGMPAARRAGCGDWAWRSRRRAPAAARRPCTAARPTPRRGRRCRGSAVRRIRGAQGVHEARISIWAVPPSSAMPPKLSVATRVTVPDAAAYVAPWASSASVSQDQPTAASNGSVIRSSSISARA